MVVTGAAGLVGLGLGSYFGLTAISKHQASLDNQAGSDADASTVSFVVALAALGVGAFLWFGESNVTVTPGVGSLMVRGGF